MPMEIGSLVSFVTYVWRRAAVHYDSPCAHTRTYPMPSEAFEMMVSGLLKFVLVVGNLILDNMVT